ncbi:UNVERIFIED_CONTAM: HlyD family secretion protein [Brevibacillus sp. OAP136]
MKKNGKLTLGLLALFLVLGGCSAGKEAAVEPKQEAAPTPVQVEPVKAGYIEISAGISGKLAPSEEVKVAPKVSGKIKDLNVKLGQQVKQGDVLFTLEQTDLNNAVQSAQAALNFAQASLNQSKTSSSQGVEQAKNSLQQAEKSLQDAQRNLQRMQQLFKDGAISTQQLEQAQLAATNAQIAYSNAQDVYQSAQKLTGVNVSEASVNQSRVTLANAQEQLANTVIKAPISGYVAMVMGASGEIASPQATVVTIVDTDPLKVKANLAEQEVTKVKVGSKVNVEITALAKTAEATVTAVSPVMDQTLKAYPIEITIPNPSGELKADMVVSVKWKADASTEKKSLIVARKAVFDEGGKHYLYLVDNNVAKKVEVTTGKESSDLIEITSGVAEGNTVVVRGQTLVKDGGKVQIQQTGN